MKKQYIDKSALVAEIDKRKIGYNTDGKHSVEYNTVKKVLDIIDTLEVEEVDLEKEAELIANNIMIGVQANKYSTVVYNFKRNDFNHSHLMLAARKGIELGLKVKQESNDEVKIGETQIYLEDDGGEPPYQGKQWLDLSCVEYIIPKTLFKDGDKVEIFIHKAQKGE